MNEYEFGRYLTDAIINGDDRLKGVILNIRNSDEVGLLTRNEVLTIKMNDGSEYQITIVQSKVAVQ